MEQNAKPYIQCENLTYVYEPNAPDTRGVEAISGVTLSVLPGEYIAVLGHNGSGKSTLAKLFNMILTPTGGRLFLFGRDVCAPDFTEDDLYEVRRDIGMVFQNPDNQLVGTVVEEDVAFGPENLCLPRAEIRRRVDDALDVVGMREYAHHAPHKLSGGQKQRVAIAGILAMKPRVILFDESTSMLDPRGRAEIVDLMEKLNREEGITILHITHYMEEAARARRILVMNDGHIELDGTPRAVFSETARLEKMGLEVPQGTRLLYELAQAGVMKPAMALGEEECAACLLSLFGGEGTCHVMQ